MSRAPMNSQPIMPIPGHIDPVPAARPVQPRADGKVDLVGLARPQIREALEAAGVPLGMMAGCATPAVPASSR